jgi:hypothetical protein
VNSNNKIAVVGPFAPMDLELYEYTCRNCETRADGQCSGCLEMFCWDCFEAEHKGSCAHAATPADGGRDTYTAA